MTKWMPEPEEDLSDLGCIPTESLPWSGWAPRSELDDALQRLELARQERNELQRILTQVYVMVSDAVGVGDAWQSRVLALIEDAPSEVAS